MLSKQWRKYGINEEKNSKEDYGGLLHNVELLVMTDPSNEDKGGKLDHMPITYT